MARYLNALAPLVLVGTVAVLTLPWLGLLALVVVSLFALAALAALAAAIVLAPYTVGRAITRHWHSRTPLEPNAALSLAERRHA